MRTANAARPELNRYDIPRGYRYAWSQWRNKPTRRVETSDDYGFIADRMTALYILIELDEIFHRSTHQRIDLLPPKERRKPGRPRKHPLPNGAEA